MEEPIVPPPLHVASDVVIDAAQLLFPGLEDSSAVYDLQAHWLASDGSGFSDHQRTALVDVPQLIDLTGNGLGDISVEVRDVATEPMLRVTKLPGAPSNLIAGVSVTLAPNGWSSAERLSLHLRSFDFTPHAENRGLPAMTRVTMTDPAYSSDDLAAEIQTTEPNNTLELSVVHGEPAFPAPPTMAARLSPVPGEATITATDLMSGFESGTVSMTTSEPNGAHIAFRAGEANGMATLVANGVSDTIEVDFTREAFATLDATLSSTGPVDELSLRFDDRSSAFPSRGSVGVGVADMSTGSAAFDMSRTRFTSALSSPTGAVGFVHGDRETYDRSGPMIGLLEGVPDSLALNLQDVVGSSVALDFEGQAVDRLDLSVGHHQIALDSSVDGVWLAELNNGFGVRARIPNPESVEITTVDGLDATATTAGGTRPFVIGTTQTPLFVSDTCERFPDSCPFAMAMLSSTPDEIHAQMDHTSSTRETTFGYTVSSAVDELLVAVDPNHGLTPSLHRCGSEQCLSARVEQPPTSVSATFDDDSFAWSAAEAVPRLDIDLTLPPDDAGDELEILTSLVGIPSDLSMTFTDTGRTGLGVDYASSGVIAQLQSQVTRTLEGEPFSDATVEIDSLPKHIDLGLVDGEPGTFNLAYQASGPAPRLRFDASSGDKGFTRLSLADPAPASFLACQSSGPGCVDSGEASASAGSVRLQASEHTTLDLLACGSELDADCTSTSGSTLDPLPCSPLLDGDCTSTSDPAVTSIENLRVRSFGFEGDITDCGREGEQACGHVWVDTLSDGTPGALTDAHDLKGRFLSRNDSTELDLNFGPAFRAAGRKAVFSNYPDHPSSPLQVTTSGEIACTPGTALDITTQLTFELSFDAAELVC